MELRKAPAVADPLPPHGHPILTLQQGEDGTLGLVVQAWVAGIEDAEVRASLLSACATLDWAGALRVCPVAPWCPNGGPAKRHIP
jgi:hypothetical protein